MAALPRRYWRDMTTAEIADMPASRTIAVLPLGAIEQHGPHLALSVDADIASAILEAALDRVDPAAPITVLPAQEIGLSEEHGDFAGTLTLTAETAIAAWTEIGNSVARAGVRKMVFLNSHGGQPRILEIVGQRLRRRWRMLAVSVNTYRLYGPAAHFAEQECVHGIHAGAIETSVMMHVRPDAVRADRIADFTPRTVGMEEEGATFGAAGVGVGRLAGFSWQSQDLHPEGAAGDARGAGADAGRALVEEAAGRLAGILTDLDAADPEALFGDPAYKASAS